MHVRPTDIPDAKVITADQFRDNRGLFRFADLPAILA